MSKKICFFILFFRAERREIERQQRILFENFKRTNAVLQEIAEIDKVVKQFQREERELTESVRSLRVKA